MRDRTGGVRADVRAFRRCDRFVQCCPDGEMYLLSTAPGKQDAVKPGRRRFSHQGLWDACKYTARDDFRAIFKTNL